MSDDYMSDNYRLRKHFLSTQEVPSQSLVKKKMSEPLAALYFKSMTPKLKVIAGLEPPMKGGGSDWYVPPKELLEGRTVLKPLKRKYMSSLNCIGLEAVCIKIIEDRHKNLILQTNKMISESDEKWKRLIEEKCEKLYKEYCSKAAKKNTEQIKQEFNEFSTLYAESLTTIESVIFDAASSEINRIQNETLQKMKDKYQTLVKQQTTEQYDTFTNKLMTESLRLRGEFVETLASNHEEIRYKIHDLKLETHVNIEEIRQFWECQRLACQVYVALKEKEECNKDAILSDRMHKKKLKILKDEILLKDYEINVRTRKEKIQLELDTIWGKKVWYVIKRFQMYVSYCLNLLPEHADFFINMEKLMLVHLNEVLENPNAESIFFEKESYEGPRADPHPFYLFCDRNQKINELPLERDLCPKHCTSSASQMPVIVINKRCMYAACDNFEQFTNKVKHYIHGERGDDADFVDDHQYEHIVPVKCTMSKQLLELKLESTLLQALNHELSNLRDTPVVCSTCKVPYCFCTIQATETQEQAGTQGTVSRSTSAGNTFNISKAVCENHAVETYLKSIQPKQCTCAKTAKKHLVEYLPLYMRSESFFDDTAKNLPSYEACTLDTLKRLVREARGDVALPIRETRDEDKTRDVAIQYTDAQYDILCACFSDDLIINDLNIRSAELLHKLYRPSSNATYFQPISVSSSSFSSLYTRDKALRTPNGDFPEIEEMFKILRKDGPSKHAGVRGNTDYYIRSNMFSFWRLDDK